MENLPKALELLLIGMITVFVILCIVILLGKLLILFVNRFFPEKDCITPKSINSTNTVDDNTALIINEIVKQITSSKGVVSNIRKL